LRLIVRQAQAAICTDQGVLRLLEMIDGLVDLINRRLEVPCGEVVVLGKTVLEGLKLAFELRDVDVLRLNERQLRLVFLKSW
jgi:hypothetical protein